jgi:hypothetical protein
VGTAGAGGHRALHLICQVEGEAAVQLRESGCQIQLGQSLAHAVAAAQREGHEAGRCPSIDQWRARCILHTILCNDHHIGPNSILVSSPSEYLPLMQ